MRKLPAGVVEAGSKFRSLYQKQKKLLENLCFFAVGALSHKTG